MTFQIIVTQAARAVESMKIFAYVIFFLGLILLVLFSYTCVTGDTALTNRHLIYGGINWGDLIGGTLVMLFLGHQVGSSLCYILSTSRFSQNRLVLHIFLFALLYISFIFVFLFYISCISVSNSFGERGHYYIVHKTFQYWALQSLMPFCLVAVFPTKHFLRKSGPSKVSSVFVLAMAGLSCLIGLCIYNLRHSLGIDHSFSQFILAYFFFALPLCLSNFLLWNVFKQYPANEDWKFDPDVSIVFKMLMRKLFQLPILNRLYQFFSKFLRDQVEEFRDDIPSRVSWNPMTVSLFFLVATLVIAASPFLLYP